MSDKNDKFVLAIDEDEFTIGDLEDFEDVAGKSFVEAMRQVNVVGDDGKPVFDSEGRPEKTVNLSPTSLKALIWISKRRTDPTFTVADARNVKVSALELQSGSTPDPKDSDA